jgi:hypothetical protein
VIEKSFCFSRCPKMSVLFYRRPDYISKPTSPINASDCAKYVERAKGSERAIPHGLSFEEVLNNKPLPVSPSCLQLDVS